MDKLILEIEKKIEQIMITGYGEIFIEFKRGIAEIKTTTSTQLKLNNQ